MAWINLTIIVLFAAATMVFALQNLEFVTVSFLGFSVRAPLAILIFVVYPSSFRRTSANDRPDEILTCSTAIVRELTEAGVVAWVMSHSTATKSPQLLMQKFARPPVRERCRRGIVVQPVMAGEGVTLTRIAVNGRVRFPCQGRFDLSLRRL